MKRTPKKTTARETIINRAILAPARLIAMGHRPDHNENLRQLTVGVGQIAELYRVPVALQDRLLRIASHCMGWLEGLGVGPVPVVISQEREQQISLLETGEIQFDCASAIVDPKRKLRALVDELGDVADCVDRLECAEASYGPVARRDTKNNLIAELVQVAAVAVAWLEALEVKP